jgi:hypothetical protein
MIDGHATGGVMEDLQMARSDESRTPLSSIVAAIVVALAISFSAAAALNVSPASRAVMNAADTAPAMPIAAGAGNGPLNSRAAIDAADIIVRSIDFGPFEYFPDNYKNEPESRTLTSPF